MKNTWHKLSHFFEYGDLTPFAVLISIAHYGPVLVAHGEHTAVAYAIGTLIDLIHFRTIRRAFMPHRNRGETAVNWLVAGVTTAMASMYHWRFYEGDYLLALPIPLGIAILAYHAADSGRDAIDRMTARFNEVVSKLDFAMSERDSFETRLAESITQRDKAGQIADGLKLELTATRDELSQIAEAHDRLKRAVDNGFVEVDQLPPKFGAVVTAVASGKPLNGELVSKHGIAQTTLDRVATLIRE